MTKSGKIKAILIFSLAAFIVAGVVAVTAKSALKIAYPIKYQELVEKYSAEYGIDKNLLYAVICTESGFNSDAVSDAEAVGLTQITPETFEWLKTKTGEEALNLSLLDPETSVKYGAFFLGYLLEEFENRDAALAAYHAGRGRVNKWLEDKNYSDDGKTLKEIPINETAHYIKKVNKAFNAYNKLY